MSSLPKKSPGFISGIPFAHEKSSFFLCSNNFVVKIRITITATNGNIDSNDDKNQVITAISNVEVRPSLCRDLCFDV